MTKQKIYTIFGLYVGPVIGFFAVLFIGTNFFEAPLALIVVFACLFAIYEFFMMKYILRKVDWDKQ